MRYMERKLRHFVRDNPILRAGAVRLGAALKSMDRAGFGLFPLVYHHVPIGQQHRFEAQLCFLKQYGTFIAPDEAVSRLREGWPARERAFLLTFDDGYADNVDVVLPVLQAHSITALLFLVAGWLEEPPRSANRTEGYMTAGDAKTWLAAGMKIGSHSYSHRR